MAKAKSPEVDPQPELPVVESVTIQELAPNKFVCIILRTKGDKMVAEPEILGEPGPKGFAVMEFKKWAGNMFIRL